MSDIRRIPGSWPADRDIRHNETPERDRNDLKNENFPSFYEYAQARLDQNVLNYMESRSPNNAVWRKFGRQVAAPIASALGGGAVSEALSLWSINKNPKEAIEKGLMEQSKFAQRLGVAQSLYNGLQSAFFESKLTSLELLKASFEKIKPEVDDFSKFSSNDVDRKMKDIARLIDSSPADDTSYHYYNRLRSHINDYLFLAGLPKSAKNLTFSSNADQAEERRGRSNEMVNEAPDEITRDERRINLKRITASSSQSESSRLGRNVIWKGFTGGTGKSSDTEKTAKNFGLDLYTYQLGNKEEIERNIVGDNKKSRWEEPSTRERIGRLAFNLGTSRHQNSMHYFNEAGNAFRDYSVSGRMKTLLDPNANSIHVDQLDVDIPINKAIFVIDDNDDPKDFLGQPTLERLSVEDYNKTKSESRKKALSNTIDDLGMSYELKDESKREYFKSSLKSFQENIFRVNESVGAQTFRLSQFCAERIAALISSFLDDAIDLSSERVENQIIKYYGQFYPSLKEGIDATSSVDERSKKYLEKSEYRLGEILEVNNKEASKRWRDYANLSKSEKLVATNNLRKKILGDHEVKEQDYAWSQGIDLELIGVHNRLNGLPSPNPSPINTREPSIRQKSESPS